MSVTSNLPNYQHLLHFIIDYFLFCATIKKEDCIRLPSAAVQALPPSSAAPFARSLTEGCFFRAIPISRTQCFIRQETTPAV